ncbi:MAG: universal stress protein [Nitrosomonas sp.]|nr:universal stress protein [Nitrosomonas sp.]
MNSNNLLVTTDFSDVSFAALTYAAKMKQSQITLLSVVQSGDVPPGLLKQMPDPDAVKKYREDIIKQTEIKLDSLAKEYFPDMNVSTKILSGDEDAASEICKYAEDNNIHMIVIAGHGRGSLGNLFIGSTVQKILRVTKLPVIVVPKEQYF